MEIVKEVPPPAHDGREYTDWNEVVRLAKEADGWVKVGPYSPGLAHHIRRGVYKQFYDEDSATPAGVQMKQHWDIQARTVSKAPHRVMIHIKWLG